jgi:DNA-binding winged helix-turn-helix (wHTH) protein/tetratricopeptide (TPR) repeat protein
MGGPGETATEQARVRATDRMYRFGAVELDLRSHRLRVAGVEQAAPARVLQLLALLCAHPGRTFSRDELIEALWPGRRVVSDESLSQVIFKLRSALGADGEQLVTVRGVGLRLDAQVASVAASEPADEPAPKRASSVSRRPAWLRLMLLFAVVAGVVGVFAAWRLRPMAVPAPMAAWGLAPAQLHAARSDTQDLVLQALQADALGDRAKARVLLSSAHTGDATTPLPALLLALWFAGAGDHDVAVQWYERAVARLKSIDDPLLESYRQFADAMVRGDSNALLADIGALLAQRPDAWILRFVRAQLLQHRGEARAALQDLASIRVERLDDRRLEDVLSDRASLGDVAGAKAALAQLQTRPDEVGYAAVSGRLAYSSGDLPRARTAFAHAAELARGHGRADWVCRGQMLAAALAVKMGDLADAHARLLDAHARALEAHEAVTALDASLMLAQLAALRGDPAERDESIAQAYVQADVTADRAWANLVEIVALRLGGLATQRPVIDDPDLGVRGLASLLGARRALASGDRIEAARKLDHARDAGVFQSIASEEASLLACELGQPAQQGKSALDPPPVIILRMLSAELPCR